MVSSAGGVCGVLAAVRNDSVYKLCPRVVVDESSVHFNKIIPAGEHMAVQNFITPFMAFQRYDDRGGPGGGGGGGGWWSESGKRGSNAANGRRGGARIFIDVNNGGESVGRG